MEIMDVKGKAFSSDIDKLKLVRIAILDARESRAEAQKELYRRYAVPIVSMTLVSPGIKKNTRTRRAALHAAWSILLQQLSSAGFTILQSRCRITAAGPECLLAVEGSASEIKELCLQLEECLPFGRILDIDVLSDSGKGLASLHREAFGRSPRRCLVCDSDAFLCIAEKRHTAAQLEKACFQLYRMTADAMEEDIAEMAVASLIAEASLPDKPGLVSPGNQGAHRDMDFSHMVSSAHALRPYFFEVAKRSFSYAGNLEMLLEILRPLGLEAEQRMYAATGGINTHKGAIFALGFFTAAAGYLAGHTELFSEYASYAEALCDIIRKIANNVASSDYEKHERLVPTNGIRWYREYSVTGARGQAERGYPLVFNTIFPVLAQGLSHGTHETSMVLLNALIRSIAELDDTCLLSRGGRAGLDEARRRASELLIKLGKSENSAEAHNVILEFGAWMREHALSPGGSADMLAAGIFLYKLNERYGGFSGWQP